MTSGASLTSICSRRTAPSSSPYRKPLHMGRARASVNKQRTGESNMKIIPTSARKLFALAVLCAMLLPTISLAQQGVGTGAQQQGGAAGESLKGVELKGKAPVN